MSSHSVAFVSGIPVTTLTWEGVLDHIGRRIQNRQMGGYACVTNTESMYVALRDPDHLRYVRGAALSLCDGIGVVLAGLTRGVRVPRRNGPVLFMRCCQHGASRGWRHCFFGGAPGVPEALATKVAANVPGATVVGTMSPPFGPVSPQEDRRIVDQINACRPDIVWVALGLPKQERWIAAHLNQIQCPWLIGVGAAFDYHVGKARWAPAWIQAIGLEWLYRLCHEPRMFERDMRGLLFLLESILGRKARDSARHPARQESRST